MNLLKYFGKNSTIFFFYFTLSFNIMIKKKQSLKKIFLYQIENLLFCLFIFLINYNFNIYY